MFLKHCFVGHYFGCAEEECVDGQLLLWEQIVSAVPVLITIIEEKESILNGKMLTNIALHSIRVHNLTVLCFSPGNTLRR